MPRASARLVTRGRQGSLPFVQSSVSERRRHTKHPWFAQCRCVQHCGLTLPSSGHPTAGSDCSLRHHLRRRCVPLTSNVRPIEMQAQFTALRCCIWPLARAVRLRGRRTDRCSRTSSSPISARAVRPSAASEPLVVLGQRSWSIQRIADASPTPARAARPSAVSEPLAVLEQRYARVPFTAVSSSSKSVSTNSQHPGFPSVMALGCVSLALRGAAAPGRGRAGTGARAASMGAFGCQRKVELVAVSQEVRSVIGAGVAAAKAMSVVRSRLASSWVRPNPSVERTANGGARLFAPSPTAAPLSAAHLKR